MTKKKHKEIGFLRAAIIQFTSKYLNVGLQLVLTAILARLLSPREYGVMAGITIFTSLFAILADMGFGPAIVQYKDLDSKDYGGIFLFSIVLGVILAACFWLLGTPIAWFFGDGSYISLCQLASVSVLFNTINMVPNGLLLKWRRFDLIGIRLIITTLIGGIVAVILAERGSGTASLIWNLNITAILVFLWNLLSVWESFSFRNIHIFQSVRKVLSFSAYQAGFGIINYFSRNMDHVLIGRFFGSAPLGLYDKAYKLTTYPIQFLPGVLGTILQPYLSDYQNDKEKLNSYQIKLVKILAIAGGYITFTFLLCGEDIVNIMYGPQWKDCIPLFLILSFTIIFQMVMNITGGILQSAGRTDLLFRQGVWATIVMLLMVFAGSMTHNLTILTICVSIAFVLQTATVAYYTTVKAFGHHMRDFLLPPLKVLLISVATFLPFAFIRFKLFWITGSSIVNLALYAIGYAIPLATVFYFTGDIKRILHILHK